jgi:phosphate transport system substrate-binding protein
MRTTIFVVLVLATLAGSVMISAAELSGKLVILVSGREQAIFVKAAVLFEKQNPKVRVRRVEPVGADSLAALTEGAADMAILGRMLTAEEKQFEGTTVGWEGIGVMVNASNRVMELNLRQVADIFTGKVKTWDELGGLESRITVIGREEGKGVRPYLEKILNVDGNMVKGKAVVEPDKEAVRIVSGALNAVSYLNLSTGLSNMIMGVPIRLLSIDKMEPEPANVSSGAYPLRRPIVLVTKSPPALAAKAFNDFMLEKEAQKTVQEEDFVPLLVTK